MRGCRRPLISPNNHFMQLSWNDLSVYTFTCPACALVQPVLTPNASNMEAWSLALRLSHPCSVTSGSSPRKVRVGVVGCVIHRIWDVQVLCVTECQLWKRSYFNPKDVISWAQLSAFCAFTSSKCILCNHNILHFCQQALLWQYDLMLHICYYRALRLQQQG